MKIAFLLKYFLHETVAGTEVYAAALCKELMALGVEVVVIKPGIGLKDFNEFYYQDIRVIEYPEADFIDKDLKTGKRQPAGLPLFKDLLLKENPDAVHIHEITGSNGITTAHIQLIKQLGFPVFSTLHLVGYTCQTGTLKYKNVEPCNGVIDTFKCSVCTLHNKGLRYGSAEILSYVGKWFQKYHINTAFLPAKLSGAVSYPLYTNSHFKALKTLFDASERVFVLSEWFKTVLVANRLPKDKMVLLPKALPYSSMPEQKIALNPTIGTTCRFVYIGRISKVKGLHTVLEAFKTVELKNWVLDIYGPVTEEDYLHECHDIIKDIRGEVNWKGKLDPLEVVNILSDYDALVFPTIIQEMVGLVVQEAFAAGTPVIGSNVNGIAEQVTDHVDGLLFEAGDAVTLKKVLERTLKDPSLLKTLAANIIAPKQFKEVALNTLEVYCTTLAGPNVKPPL